MPVIATILVSPHPLQPGRCGGRHWSERQTARCSNDFLRGTDSGPPRPSGDADSIVSTIEPPWLPIWTGDVAIDPVPGGTGNQAEPLITNAVFTS